MISPAKYSPGTFFDAIVFGSISPTLTPPEVIDVYKRQVKRVGMVRAPAVIDPVAALDGLDRLGGGGQLLLLEFLNVHRWSPPE